MRLPAFLLMCLAGQSTLALGQEVATIRGASNTDIRVNGYAWTDKDCKAVKDPPVAIVVPAEHGAFCQRPHKMLLKKTIVNNLDYCLDKPVDGVEILYVSDAGYVGPDMGRITVTFDGKTHVVDVGVTVVRATANQPPSRFDLLGGQRQQAGPVPPCTPPQTALLRAAP